MRGFSGLIAPTPQPRHVAEISRLAESMRGVPLGGSTHRDLSDIGARIAWVNASDDAGSGSVWSADALTGLLFVGETCPADSSSRASGAVTSEARVHIEAYQREGASFIEKLNGLFCGVIIDRRRGTLTLFNDRYGMGRIYYHEAPDSFYFSTQAKALLTVLPRTRALDPQSLAEFVLMGCVLQNRSLYSGIKLLPPGSIWTFNQGGRSVSRRRYFDPAKLENQPRLSAPEYQEQLCGVFRQAVARCCRGADPIALSLTGGLDSRAIIAWTDAPPGSLPCYTFGGPYRDCADVRIARQIAAACGHPHTTLQVGGDFFSDFESLARRTIQISDGTMDVSGAVELHVNHLAKAIAPVRLTGNYGSEILRSNVALRPAHIDESRYAPEFRPLLRQAVETYASELRGDPLSFIAFKQVPWHHYARRTVESAELRPRSPFLDNDLVALAFRAPAELRTSVQPMMDLIGAGNPALIALKTDRALRARGIPVLSKVSCGWTELTVKAEYAYDYGMPRWLARTDRILSPLHIERLFLGRHKFYHFRVWYRDRLGDYVLSQANDTQASVLCYGPGQARRIAEDHVFGRRNQTLELHRLLTLQLIEKHLLAAQ